MADVQIGNVILHVDADTGQVTGKLTDLGDAVERTGRRIKDHLGKDEMKEARGGMMLFGDLVGIHLPRHVTSFIASLGPVAGAMEAAFPFLAIAVGAAVLIEHFTKLHEAARKLEDAAAKLDITLNTTFLNLEDKLLESQIKADELAGNHLGAVEKKLTLIDHASMKELMGEFDRLKTAVDGVFKEMDSHWYTLGKGSAGAKASLDEIVNTYDRLASSGKPEDIAKAAKFLGDNLERDKKILEDMRTVATHQAEAGHAGGTAEKEAAAEAALARLKEQGAVSAIRLTDKELQSQSRKVDVLEHMNRLQEVSNVLNEQNKGNVHTEEANRQSNEAFKRMKDDNRQQEQLEREAERVRLEKVQSIHDTENEAISLTKAGSKERLAAIEAAIHQEVIWGRTDMAQYKSLSRERNQLIIQMADEEARIKAEAGKIQAEHDIKMAELGAAAELEQIRHRQATRRRFFQSDLADAVEVENKEFEIKKKAIENEIKALDKGDKDYQNKKKALENKELQNEQQHQNKLQAIRDKAMEHMADQFQKTFSQMNSELENFVMTGQFSFSKLAQGFITQVMDMALQYGESKLIMMAMDKIFGVHKAAANVGMAESNTAVAATEALASVPWPFNIAAAGETEAMGQGFAAQASVGVFHKGGLAADEMPAILQRKEMVLDSNLSSHIMATAGGGGGKGSGNVHYNPIIQGNADEAKLHAHFERFMKQQARKRGQRWN